MWKIFALWNGRERVGWADEVAVMKISRHNVFGCFGLVALCFVVVCTVVGRAQADQQDARKVSGEVSVGAVKDGENVASFRSVLIPEIYEMVRSGVLQIKVVDRLSGAWDLKNRKELQEKGNTVVNLAEDNSIVGLIPGISPGIPFLDQIEEDSSQSGIKVLWNIHSLWWSQKIIDFEFVLMELNKQMRQVGGRLLRVYPHMLGAQNQYKQLWREKLSLRAPSGVRGLTWLTFRFLGDEEDLLWVYSPAIKKVRQITGANRSDGFVSSAISADDFLTWSGRPEAVVVSGVGRAGFLVPFFGPEAQRMAKVSASCQGLTINPLVPTLSTSFDRTLNYDSAPRMIGGALAGVSFAMRELLVIELAQNNPYTLYGRQVLYVDSETFLPVYKVVFDRLGKQWKAVFTVWGVGESQGKIPSYFPVATFSHDRNAPTWTVVSYDKIKNCSQYTDEITLAGFDPAKLAP